MQHNDPSTRLVAEAKAMRYSRRTVLKRASALGLSSAAVGNVLAATGHAAASPNRAPAMLQGGTLNLLVGTAYVPAAEAFFEEQANTFGQENNVDVTVDFLNWPDLQPRTTAAIQAGGGPDIVELWDAIPYLFAESLVPIPAEIATQLEDVQGGYYDWVTNTASIDGEWKSVPYGTSSVAVAYRKSFFEQAGVADPENNFPKTWEELFEVGKILKQEVGKPLGQTLGQDPGDAPAFTYPYMWSFESMEIDEEGEVAFDTEAFREGLELFVKAWPEAFDETGLGWDGSTNNSAYLSGQISATLNGSSIYLEAANEDGDNFDPELAEDTFHAPLPSGPGGQFAALGSRSLGVLDYSSNQDEAMAFLEWWYSAEPFQAWLEVYEGYIIPPGPAFIELPVFTENAKLAPFTDIVNIGRNKGFAGPSNLQAAQVSAQYIIPNAFNQAVQTGDVGSAIDQAVQLMQRIYDR